MSERKHTSQNFVFITTVRREIAQVNETRRQQGLPLLEGLNFYLPLVYPLHLTAMRLLVFLIFAICLFFVFMDS